MSLAQKTTQDGETHDNHLGWVAGLWRYPVKSMGAESLEKVDLSWHGLSGDRRWAFVRGGVERSGFPWLTIRERADMGNFQPRFVDPSKPNTSATRVRTPDGRDFDVADPALAAELGHDARVIKQNRGVFDTLPLSLITTQTVAELGAMVGAKVDVRRFRPNILVEATSRENFPEDAWVGGVLQIGDATLRVDKRDKRCVVVNVDPETARQDSSTLRAIARAREGCLGVYGSTVKPGHVAVGDPVYLEGWTGPRQ